MRRKEGRQSSDGFTNPRSEEGTRAFNIWCRKLSWSRVANVSAGVCPGKSPCQLYQTPLGNKLVFEEVRKPSHCAPRSNWVQKVFGKDLPSAGFAPTLLFLEGRSQHDFCWRLLHRGQGLGPWRDRGTHSIRGRAQRVFTRAAKPKMRD